jgi:uncharacterized protein YegP (UPF0339 family)
MRRSLKVEVYKDRRGLFRWRVRAGNGLILARSSGSFPCKDKLLESLAHVLDAGLSPAVYKDRVCEWRWRVYCCGELVAVSSESYKSRQNAVDAAELFLNSSIEEPRG